MCDLSRCVCVCVGVNEFVTRTADTTTKSRVKHTHISTIINYNNNINNRRRLPYFAFAGRRRQGRTRRTTADLPPHKPTNHCHQHRHHLENNNTTRGITHEKSTKNLGGRERERSDRLVVGCKDQPASKLNKPTASHNVVRNVRRPDRSVRQAVAQEEG